MAPCRKAKSEAQGIMVRGSERKEGEGRVRAWSLAWPEMGPQEALQAESEALVPKLGKGVIQRRPAESRRVASRCLFPCPSTYQEDPMPPS